MQNWFPAGLMVMLMIGCCLLCSGAGQADEPTGGEVTPEVPRLINPGFSAGTPDDPLAGWNDIPLDAELSSDYAVEVDPTHGLRGTPCALLRNLGPVEISEDNYAIIHQRVDATGLRDHRVAFAAEVRLEVEEGEFAAALLVVRAERGGDPGNVDTLETVRCDSEETDWGWYETVFDVDEDVTALHVGVMLVGHARVRVDDTSFRDYGRLVHLAGPPRPLTDRGLDNLVAFTRLLGYVRHFHCSDESFNCDWDEFAVRAISVVEPAGDPADLTRLLEELFKPLAPALTVYETAAGRPEVEPWYPEPLTDDLYVHTYRHQGCSQVRPGPNIYETSQIVRPVDDQDYIGTALDPNCPFEADLGGGVSCLLPLAVFADFRGTLPHAVPAPRPPDYGLLKYSGNDRTTRLAGVALAWNVAQHFYPYFDVVDTDWPAALREALVRAATDSDEVEYLATLRRMQAAMIDGHARVYHACSPDECQVPLVLSWAGDRLVVSRIADDGAGGLVPGDVVTRINNRPVDEVVRESEPCTAAATPQRLRYVIARQLIRGIEGEEITFAVEALDGSTRTATLSCTLPAGSLTDTRPEPFCEIRPGIYYLGLARGTENDIEQYLPRLEQARGIIVDYRGIPGAGRAFLAHLATETMLSARFIVPVYTEPDQRNIIEWYEGERWEVEPAEPHLTAPVIFLIDAGTQSYLECLAEFAEAYSLGELVGGTTSGSNGNVNPYTIPGGYTMHYTGMIVLKNDGSQHHAVGIQPTVSVERTVEGIAAGRDEILEKAIEMISR